MKRSVPSSSPDVSCCGSPAAPMPRALPISAFRSPPEAILQTAQSRTGKQAWARWLLDGFSAVRQELSEQKRALRVLSCCTGMCGEHFALEALDVKHEILSASDLKLDARLSASFHVEAGHVYDDMSGQLLPPSSTAKCSLHPGANCQDKQRPDLLVAGFPCQPFSKLGSAAKTREGPRSHPQFPAMKQLLEVIANRRPRMCVIENVETMDVAYPSTCDDQLSPLQEFVGFLRTKARYNCRVVNVNARDFHEGPRGNRLFFMATDQDVDTSGLMLSRALGWCVDAVADRRNSPPTPFVGSLLDFEAQPPAKKPRKSSRMGWKADHDAIMAGIPGANSNRWFTLGGVSKQALGALTEREADAVEVDWALLCSKAGVSFRDRGFRKGKFADVSQAPSYSRYGTISDISLLRSTKVYSYEKGQVVPSSVLCRSLGYPSSYRFPNVIEASSTADLLGESFSLPALSVAMYPLILSTEIPDMWTGPV
eukprot:TRINITY_DN55868_c0_g1_i2.p1 TRINITY_DN55868_c0_g1~~TRINITY_DN55868_c0_g1_i2.p1  ORF type:complete len:482 (+),score=38.97 TRINITY_DN55868_c0_g1_i2:155-1600(+)